MNKIVDRQKISDLVDILRKDGKTIVFTNGCFDILHFGHINLLKEASKYGDVLIVGLNSDSSIKRLKGKNRPIQCEKYRSAILEAISYVSYVIIYKTNTPLHLIKLIRPDFLVKGGDYKEKQIVGAEFSKQVIITKLIKDLSTTKIIKGKR